MNKWRIPTIEELVSIIDYSKHSPTTLLPGMQSSDYWSSTTYAGNPDYAWYVDFYYGYVYDVSKNYAYYVRCVRAGQSGGLFDTLGKNKRFIKKRDCFLDKKTGLEWALKSSDKPMLWEDAMKWTEETPCS